LTNGKKAKEKLELYPIAQEDRAVAIQIRGYRASAGNRQRTAYRKEKKKTDEAHEWVTDRDEKI